MNYPAPRAQGKASSKLSGECLEYNEMCYFEDQEKCSKYSPKYK